MVTDQDKIVAGWYERITVQSVLHSLAQRNL